MAYYILVSRQAGKWAVEFGDYDKEAVEWERVDHRTAGVSAKDLKIIKIRSARQADTDEAIAAMNAPASLIFVD